MSTSFIVYLASISTGIHVFLGIGAATALIAALVFFIARCDENCKFENRPKYFKYAWISLIAMMMLIGFSAIIPMEADVYKIAGVSEQEKAAINASGNIIELKNKSDNE